MVAAGYQILEGWTGLQLLGTLRELSAAEIPRGGRRGQKERSRAQVWVGPTRWIRRLDKLERDLLLPQLIILTEEFRQDDEQVPEDYDEEAYLVELRSAEQDASEAGAEAPGSSRSGGDGGLTPATGGGWRLEASDDDEGGSGESGPGT